MVRKQSEYSFVTIHYMSDSKNRIQWRPSNINDSRFSLPDIVARGDGGGVPWLTRLPTAFV